MRQPPRPRDRRAWVAFQPEGDPRGFSLMEAIIATAISVIAVLGLAYTFGVGRGLIGRYEVARAALGVAQGRVERYAGLVPAAVVPGTRDSVAFLYQGNALGMEVWAVDWADLAFDGTGGADADGPNDLKQLTVTVRWGVGVESQSVQLTRLLPR